MTGSVTLSLLDNALIHTGPILLLYVLVLVVLHQYRLLRKVQVYCCAKCYVHAPAAPAAPGASSYLQCTAVPQIPGALCVR